MGSAGWLMGRTEAQLWMTRSEWLSARAIRLDDTEELLDGIVAFYKRTGLGEADVADMRQTGNSYRRMVAPIPPTFNRLAPARSEERSVGNKGVRKLRSRWVPVA